MSIDFENNSGVSFDFDQERLIQILVEQTVEVLGCPYQVGVSVSVVTSEEIRRVNREFREIDKVTDVLSFPMNEFDEAGVFAGDAFEASMTVDPETDELLLGDIVLCADRVRSQAEEYGHSEKREYAFLIVHSLLHLSGFDHIVDTDRLLMEDKQRQILDLVGINR